MRLSKYKNYQTATKLITSLYQWVVISLYILYVSIIIFSFELQNQFLILLQQNEPYTGHWHFDTFPALMILSWTETEGNDYWSYVQCFQCVKDPRQNQFHPICKMELAYRAIKPKWRKEPRGIFALLITQINPSWLC